MSVLERVQKFLPVVAWFLWIFIGTLFYGLHDKFSLPIAIYQSTNIGWALGWSLPYATEKSDNPMSMIYSCLHNSIGVLFIGIAVMYIAEALTQSKDDWTVEVARKVAIERDQTTGGKCNAVIGWVRLNRTKCIVIALAVAICVVGIIVGVLGDSYNFGEASDMTLSTLTCSGYRGLTSSAPSWAYVLLAVYTNLGVPLLAISLGSIISFFMENPDQQAFYSKIAAPVTDTEMGFMRSFGIDNGDGRIELNEFIILIIVRISSIDPSVITQINKRYQELDKYNDGKLAYDVIVPEHNVLTSTLPARTQHKTIIHRMLHGDDQESSILLSSSPRWRSAVSRQPSRSSLSIRSQSVNAVSPFSYDGMDASHHSGAGRRDDRERILTSQSPQTPSRSQSNRTADAASPPADSGTSLEDPKTYSNDSVISIVKPSEKWHLASPRAPMQPHRIMPLPEETPVRLDVQTDHPTESKIDVDKEHSHSSVFFTRRSSRSMQTMKIRISCVSRTPQDQIEPILKSTDTGDENSARALESGDATTMAMRPAETTARSIGIHYTVPREDNDGAVKCASTGIGNNSQRSMTKRTIRHKTIRIVRKSTVERAKKVKRAHERIQRQVSIDEEDDLVKVLWLYISVCLLDPHIQAILVWFLWLILAAVFYSVKKEVSFYKGFYKSVKGLLIYCASVNVGYSIYWTSEDEDDIEKAFSVCHLIVGQAMVSFAMAAFAQSLLAGKNLWYMEFLKQAEMEDVMKSQSLWSKIVLELYHFLAEYKVALLFVLWLGFGVTWSVLNIGWPVVQGFYFSITSLSTGGIWSIPDDSPDSYFFVVACFSCTGVPIMAITFGTLAHSLSKVGCGHILSSELNRQISLEELEMMHAVGIEDGDGYIDRCEYVILILVRLRALRPELVATITERFNFLDNKRNGWLTYDEMQKR